MIALAVALSALGTGVTVWLLMRREEGLRCPTCQTAYTVVHQAGDGLDTSYDVLACPTCTNAITRVHGQRSPLAYCPACHQRAMTPVLERAPEDGLAVRVHEQCHLCGHDATHTMQPPRMARVLAFPGRAEHKPDHPKKHGRGS